MAFSFDFSSELEETLSKLLKKDKKRYETVWKKVEKIASRDSTSIDFYKNLRYPLKDYKRVHIDKSFVLLFKIMKEKNYILFDKLKHHDDVYKP
ncbi:MAG: addiction module toxin RelE [Candidatus Diapherotrites archaeon]